MTLEKEKKKKLSESQIFPESAVTFLPRRVSSRSSSAIEPKEEREERKKEKERKKRKEESILTQKEK